MKEIITMITDQFSLHYLQINSRRMVGISLVNRVAELKLFSRKAFCQRFITSSDLFSHIFESFLPLKRRKTIAFVVLRCYSQGGRGNFTYFLEGLILLLIIL